MSVQCTGSVQYKGGCSVHWGDNMSTLRDSVHRGDIMINVGEGHWENNEFVRKP